MKKLLILIICLITLSQEVALGQGNSGKIKDKTNNGNGNGNGKGQVPTDPSTEVGLGLTTLPVTLTSFEVSAVKNQVNLTWTTATEENNAYFQVERSLDGLNFSTIGQVTGHGTTQQIQNYSFNDAKPVSGTLYYRLKQVDLDGDHELSPVKAVKATAPLLQKLAVYPNPVISDLHVELNPLSAGNYTITITSISNGLVKQKTVQAGELVTLSLQNVPAGAYILTIAGENFKQTNKFFKN
jgi:hypothetical protein